MGFNTPKKQRKRCLIYTQNRKITFCNILPVSSVLEVSSHYHSRFIANIHWFYLLFTLHNLISFFNLSPSVSNETAKMSTEDLK